MKKRLIALFISILFIFCAVTVLAEDNTAEPTTSESSAATETKSSGNSEKNPWSEEYYRATDSTGVLSDAQRDTLEVSCLEFINKWHLDLAMLAIPHDKYENLTITELAAEYYTDCGFGYGDDHDGFMMVLYTDTGEIAIVPIGAALGRVPQDYLDYIAESAASYQEDYGTFGPMYVVTKMLNDYMADPSVSWQTEEQVSEQPEELSPIDGSNSSEKVKVSVSYQSDEPVLDENGIPLPSLRIGVNGTHPAWYPKDPYSFPEYHDPNASRVVDNADILSDEEETVMNERLSVIRKELDKDIVIFTDVSSYGMDEMAYAADFYDFNGYGCGIDYEGVCLFVCMDPNDRGWWVCCTGPETKSLYTEEIANQIDDMLFDFMVDGKYYDGISDWIENFRRLYLTGSPYTPEWASLMQDSTFKRTHNATAPRIVDEALLLTEQEITALESKAAEIAKKYNTDIVVHTTRNEGTIDRDRYSELYYYYNGYGYGDNYDGILLTVFKRPYDSPFIRLYASGTGSDKLTDVNAERLKDRCEDLLDDSQYYEAIDQWLDQTDHMLKTGRAPKAPSDWIFTIVLELAAGLIIGFIALSRAKAGMATPAIKEDADSYYDPNSLQVRSVNDIHTGTTSTRTYDPVRTDDDRPSGSSSSGRSSYSSSYKGSSGRTHSGSGRRF